MLLDPFAEQVFFPPDFSRAAAMKPGANDGRAPLGVLPVKKPTTGKFARPRHPWHEIVIYELHVKGFTARANSGVTKEKRGTFLGLIEKIPYLKELGVTVVELLPVHQFDPQEGNYWGYMTLNFFAPHQGYARARRGGGVSRDGPRLSCGGNRGVARRGVQPYVRSRSDRSDVFVARD